MAREARAVGRLDVPREARRSFAVPRYDPDAFGRFAETFARFMGTARFLVYMTVFVIVWMGWNILAPQSLRFDDYPFIFLTLMLSLQASYAAPLILLAQNRQADRDRVTYEQDRARSERTIADTEYITRELASLRISLGDVATRDFLRSELRDLLDELREQLRDEIRKDVRKDMRKTLRGRDGVKAGAADGGADDVEDELSDED